MSNWLKVLFEKFKIGSRDNSLEHALLPVAFVCVADTEVRFTYQAARLLLSLRWFGGSMKEAPFYLCTTAELSKETVGFFTRHGAKINYCEPFYSNQPNITSNKLRGLEINDLKNFEHIVLIDCDTLIVNDPSDYCAVAGVGLKLADVPTVKDEKLEQILDGLGVAVPDHQFEYELADAQTFGYFNSGVIVLSQKWLRPIAENWSKRCRQLLDLETQLEIPPHFVEQSALAATVAELDVPLTILPASMNLPVHFLADRYPDSYNSIDPHVIHYHWLTHPDGYIKELPLTLAQLRAESFNSRLRAEISENREVYRNQFSSSPTSSATIKKPKVIVGTGWWSDKKSHDWALGSDVTRSTAFFSLWYRQVVRYLNPDRIIVTDSRSPFKPDFKNFRNVHWIELDKNYGGPNDVRVGKIKTKFSGFTKSVINGAMHALCCDADFYVYVEQDCLIKGERFLEHALGESDAEIFLGQRTVGGKGIEGKPAASMIQQSCIIVKKSGLERFISRTLEGPETDGELSPEVKMDRDLKPYDFVQIPFGRSRPIDFSLNHFYAQHLDQNELEEFMGVEGLNWEILCPNEKYILDI
jgi:hypothetical protein